MKSGRQVSAGIKMRRTGKRAAIRAEVARAQAKQEAKARALQLRGQVLVNPANLRPTNSFGTPDFVVRGFYVEMPFACKMCGKSQVWTATQQKWWYESAKGDVWTIAVLCRPCRAGERERKTSARKVRLDGLAKKVPRRI
jgi:hypothetical protein